MSITDVWERIGNKRKETAEREAREPTEKQKLSAEEATAQVLLADAMVGPRERMLARLQARSTNAST